MICQKAHAARQGQGERDMPTKTLLSILAAGFAVLLSQPAAAQTAALAGQVTSAEEGAMEGVVISAQKDGSTITYSVVSDDKGHFSFPAAKLGAGHYTLAARAAGYDLDGPKAADVAAGQASTADLKLRKTKNLPHQLTNAEWMLSVPGTEDQKTNLINCVSCHTVERIVRSTHDADEFVQVQARMASYAQVSQPIKPQVRMEQSRAANPEQRFRKNAEFLASINLSEGPWQYELKTLPRVKGRGTHVLITEYDLPRKTIEPHDVIVDARGQVWYSNFGEMFLGKLDPNTGKASEIALPEYKKGYPSGTLDIEFDKTGNIWLGMMYQASIMKFDPKTEKFQFWQVPQGRNREDSQLNMVTMNFDVDGKLWVNDAGPSTIFRVDLAGNKFEEFDPIASLPGGHKSHSIYDIAADSQNNLYMTDFIQNYIMRIDAKTGKLTTYQVPTPFARNRRGNIDDKDRFWFAEYRGNKIGMLDTKAEEIKEWPLPTPHTHPYDVIWDKDGELWTGGMTTDRVVRLDPKTGQAVEYPLPRDTNMRRMFVDNATTPPTFWVGSNHGASIVKVEPLD
jgi:streptogramin lyase